jgi:hypothetical protein
MEFLRFEKKILVLRSRWVSGHRIVDTCRPTPICTGLTRQMSTIVCLPHTADDRPSTDSMSALAFCSTAPSRWAKCETPYSHLPATLSRSTGHRTRLTRSCLSPSVLRSRCVTNVPGHWRRLLRFGPFSRKLKDRYGGTPLSLSFNRYNTQRRTETHTSLYIPWTRFQRNILST